MALKMAETDYSPFTCLLPQSSCSETALKWGENSKKSVLKECPRKNQMVSGPGQIFTKFPDTVHPVQAHVPPDLKICFYGLCTRGRYSREFWIGVCREGS